MRCRSALGLMSIALLVTGCGVEHPVVTSTTEGSGGVQHSRPPRPSPQGASDYLNRAKAFHQQGVTANSAEIIAQCTRAIELDPTLAEAYALRANAFNEQNEFGRAEADCDAAIQKGLNDASTFHLRGQIRTDLAKFSDAVSDFSEAIRLEPSNPSFHYSRGYARFNKKDFAAAIPDFTECIRVAAILIEQSISVGSQMGVQVGPIFQSMAYEMRGKCAAQMGNDRDAIADLSDAIRLSSDPKPDLLFVRGYAYFKTENFTACVEDATEVLRLTSTESELLPQYKVALALRAEAYGKLGQRALAARDQATLESLQQER